MYTYLREQVPETNTGTCPCCLKQQRVTKRGVVTRHGWQETGRQVGSYGQGFQWGECAGWNKRPLETTDADALVVLETLTESLARLRLEIQRHQAGVEFYKENVSLRDTKQVQGYEAALNRLGLSFQRLTQSVTRYETMELFIIMVPRGHAEIKVADADVGGWGRHIVFVVRSWENLRQKTVRGLEGTLAALESQYGQIQEARVYHRDNPSNGIPATVKAATVHFRREWEQNGQKRARIACGSKTRTANVTTVAAETTCKRCLASMAKD